MEVLVFGVGGRKFSPLPRRQVAVESFQVGGAPREMPTHNECFPLPAATYHAAFHSASHWDTVSPLSV